MLHGLLLISSQNCNLPLSLVCARGKVGNSISEFNGGYIAFRPILWVRDREQKCFLSETFDAEKSRVLLRRVEIADWLCRLLRFIETRAAANIFQREREIETESKGVNWFYSNSLQFPSSNKDALFGQCFNFKYNIWQTTILLNSFFFF